MRLHPLFSAALLVGAVSTSGCQKVPLTPKSPIPAGQVVFRFTRTVKGPVELNLDGARMPIEQLPKGATSLTVKGLSIGKHRFFLTSQREIFSPDTGELDLQPDHGLYFVTLTQTLDSVLYGKPDPLPAAEGIPGVTVTLMK